LCKCVSCNLANVASQISALTGELQAVTLESSRRHEEYQTSLSALSVAQEDRSRRSEAAHRIELSSAVSAEAAKHSAALQDYAAASSSLQHQLQLLSADKASLTESLAALRREYELLQAADRSAQTRAAGLQQECADKTRSLEAVLTQLERAELKAAKEARKRMDMERLMKRIDSSFDQLMLGQSQVHSQPQQQQQQQQKQSQPPQQPQQLQQHQPTVDSAGQVGGGSVEASSLSVHERMRLRGWQN